MPHRSRAVLGGNIRIASVSLLLACLISTPAWKAAAQGKELKGFSVIERVISPGAEPVYQVDGYRVQIVASTDKEFRQKLDSLKDVGPGIWLRFTGKRDSAGVVVAVRATFYPGKSGVKQPDPLQLQTRAPDHESLIDSEGRLKPLDTKVRLSDSGGWCGWHKIPAEGEEQARVRRIGMSLIPAYQGQMADDQAGKIHFRFFVIDEKVIRSELACNPGLVLVPRLVFDRLKSDDQLAAVLADGIARNLQYLRARMVASDGWLTAAEIAENAAWVANPIAGLAIGGAVGIAAHDINVQMELERGRLGLSLMADAGYDPWQAPEAWRLLAPKRLPKDLSSLKYPRVGQYQVTVLDAQYKKRVAVAQ
jgi:hypothetical protein